MNQHAYSGIRTKAMVMAVASALLALANSPARAISYVATPQAQASVSAAGFKHPAMGFTLEQLEYARQQVRADVEPYKTYYNTLTTVCCSYANINLQPTNRDATKVDTPNTPNFNNGTGQTRIINDSQGALTQALLYYMTGQNDYRRNAMRILRTWSNMNPDGYAYFPDAHIHTGVPLFRMLLAAEIMRYTPGDTSYAAYPLAWTATDTQKLKDNLIDPMERTFFASNERFMNQHVYSIVGRLAGAIFTDNRARYDETVEWLTVNATSTRQDINGGILPLIPRIEADDPLNLAGVAFYQIQEMKRDQAHGGDNVDNLIGLLRLVTAQGTKVDPYTGRPSTASDAVSVYKFGGNRVLMGANSYAQFMLGYNTPWADTSGGSSTMSEAYRGRLFEAGGIPEVYNVYKYEEGVDVDTLAPYLTTAAAHADGPVTRWGQASPANKDFGAEAFITLPRALTGIPLPVSTGMLETERKSIFLNGDWQLENEGDRRFGRAQVTPSGATVVFHDIVYADRSKYAPVGVMVRTNAVTKLAASATETGKPWCEMTVPNTGGQWRYIVPDASTAATTGKRLGDNIIYFKFTGAQGATVDVDFVNLAAPTQLTPPRFTMPVFPVTEYVVQGMPYQATYTATDANPGDTVTYQAINSPAGATLDTSTGKLAWTPAPSQVGLQDIVVGATDGVAISTMTARLSVQPDRATAFSVAMGNYDASSAYTTPSLAAFQAELAPLRQAMLTVSDAEFPALLKQVQVVTQKLELVNPRLASDGSLDWSKNMVTTTVLNSAAIPNLLDDDYNTTSGDLRDVVTLDFGENYRVAVNAFGFRPRFMFGNRGQGINVYGSQDKASWTLLTSRETSDTSNQDFIMETIPVVAGLENEQFRYFMVRVDHPGPPTDPAYPGISSYSELHFHGSRFDLLAPVDVSASVRMLQSGLTMNRFTQKYSGTVSFTNTTQQTIKGPLHFQLENLTAGVTLDAPTGIKDGAPYITLPATDLAPGQSVTVTTTFSNPSKAAISYGRKLISAKY